MSKEAGVPRTTASREQRKAWGIKVWELGELFREGKTQRKRDRQEARRRANAETS